MKKPNTISFWCCLLFFFGHQFAHAQFLCSPEVAITLDANGSYILFPEDVLVSGDLAGYTPFLTPDTYTCEDIGFNVSILEIYEGNTLVYSCNVSVLVHEDIPPTANCTASVSVSLDANGQHVFTVQELNNGSFDNCSLSHYTITPPLVQCGDNNPLTVNFTAVDVAGNFNACYVTVNWSPYPNPTVSLACNDAVVVALAYGEQRLITPDLILEGGPYGCPDRYEVEISVGGNPRPAPIVTLADTNLVLLVSVTDLETGTSCWGNMSVTPIAGCTPSFLICDTACNSTPLGDCTSGHTDTDNIEWPCDVIVSGDCSILLVNPTPEVLLAMNAATSENVTPVLVDAACYYIGINYSDQIFITDTENRVKRTWAVLNWESGDIAYYEQWITLMYDSLDICDTQPWNSPVNGCAGGHSLEDDVEWPGDITLDVPFTHPDDLLGNPDVNDADAYPTLFVQCEAISTTFLDNITILNDSTRLIERTWTVFEFVTENSWSYMQSITVIGNASASTVCVTRESNEPIPGVELIGGIYTDGSGCHDFEDPAGIVVTPIKDSPWKGGVNVLDKIIMMEHLLGIKPMSPFQLRAADINHSQGISAIDLVLMDALINDTYVPAYDHAWQFFERNTMAPMADITDPLQAYRFIGVKLGDLDNSYNLIIEAPMPKIAIHVTDEIINKKEDYAIPFALSTNQRITGFSVTIHNPDENIIIHDVTSNLPDFTAASNVITGSGLLTIQWIAPPEFLTSGYTLTAGTPLFTVSLESTENAILSEELTIEPGEDNVLKRSGDGLVHELIFEWQDQIINHVIELEDLRQISIAPNPVADVLHLQGVLSSDKGHIIISDATGRTTRKEVLTGKLQVDELMTGMYFLALEINGHQTRAIPFIKL